MSSDDEDYMSDKFLGGSTTKDVRPGLIRNRAKQREVEVAAKKAKKDEDHRKKTSGPSRIQERLQEGLNSAISSDNKGFAMLAKMGYKQGQSLGKNSSGIVEPIGISIKSDRAGLGREAALLELKEKRKEIRRKRLLAKSDGAEVTIEEFRKRMTQKSEDKFTESAIRKCQSACERLDLDNKVEKPPIDWFWQIRNLEKDEENADEVEDESQEDDEESIVYEPSEKLDMLTTYLRTTYNYCHWCGTHYDDVTDLMENCPGPGKDDH